jgi:hypothetical protein
MYRTLSASQKFAATLASAIIAGAGLILTLKLNLAPTYPDFIVGSITWRNEGKLQDLLVGPITIAVFAFCLLYLVKQFARLNRDSDTVTADEATMQLLWWSVPALFATGLLITGTKADADMALLSSAGLTLTAWTLARFAPGSSGVSPAIAGWTFFGLLLISLIPMEVALVLGRLPMNYMGGLNLQSYIYATYGIASVGFVLLAIAIHTQSRAVTKFLPHVLTFGQIGAAFLVFNAYPARLLSPSGEIIEYRISGVLPLILTALALWAIFDVFTRFRRFQRTDATSLSLLLSPSALFFVVAVAKAGATLPPHISPDDYHIGERLVGSWAYLKGMVPYVDYLPPHGLIDDDLIGLLVNLFFDGTAAPVAEASRLAFWLLGFITVIAVERFTGSIGLALITAFFLGGSRLSGLFLTLFLCLWFSQGLRASPSRWLATWILCAPILLLTVMPHGTILVAASVPYVLFLVWRSFAANNRSWMKAPAVALGVLLMLSIVTPLPSMLLAAIRYVRENGPINQIAYGLPWADSLGSAAPSWIFFEFARMSWIAVPLVCAFLAHRLYSANERRIDAYMPVAVVFILSLLLIPYSMGRIGPAHLSRPGLVAQFGWVALIPLVAWGFMPRPISRQLLITVIVLAGAALGSLAHVDSVSVRSFLHNANGKVAAGILTYGASFGLPNLGVSEINPVQRDRLLRLNRALTKLLAPGETYLDLTSRSAHYFYLDKLPPVAVTAPYNMVPLAQQHRAVEQLKRKPVRVALLQADNVIHDGGGLALRSPLLFRFVMDNYLPVWSEGFVFGVLKHPDHAPDELRFQSEIRAFSDGNWERGINRREAAFLAVKVTPFTVGSTVHFPGGDVRRITRVWDEGNAVWVDGAPLDPGKMGAPNMVTTLVSPETAAEYRARLMDAAFVGKDLAKIPVSWGRSESSLASRMALVHKLDAVPPRAVQLRREGNAYAVEPPASE